MGSNRKSPKKKGGISCKNARDYLVEKDGDGKSGGGNKGVRESSRLHGGGSKGGGKKSMEEVCGVRQSPWILMKGSSTGGSKATISTIAGVAMVARPCTDGEYYASSVETEEEGMGNEEELETSDDEGEALKERKSLLSKASLDPAIGNGDVVIGITEDMHAGSSVLDVGQEANLAMEKF